MDENGGLGSNVGAVRAIDLDTGNFSTLFYSISGNGAENFYIDSSTVCIPKKYS